MMKSAFPYRNGILCAESIPLAEIAEQIDTPFYCTSVKQLQRNYRHFAGLFAETGATIHYQVRANPNLALIRTLADCGAGACVASAGELERALEAGVAPHKIVLSGAGKTRDDIAAALLAGVALIQAESLPDLYLIDQVADILGRPAPVVLAVHLDQKMGAEPKAGLPLDHLAEAIGLAHTLSRLVFKGFAVLPEAPGQELASLRAGCGLLAELVRMTKAQGLAVEHLSLGGGGSPPTSTPPTDELAAYAALVRETLGGLGCQLSLEPGRRLVSDASVLVSRVVHVKKLPQKRFLILDAGMNDFVLPALHGARHDIVPVRERSNGSSARVSVAGPLGEARDVFGDDYVLPDLKAGELVAILQAGAYGSAMASTYNGRALAPEILVSGVHYAVTRRRIAVAEQMAWESLPDWMAVRDVA